ncbi:MAG: HDOD domain-containing protein [Candidatus Latescibacteria bacterium]|jgi:HD-like signal output (HDOD) protein/CheY-like chemotaxis protein|nr:HDOD domain-containing protein [Candidatus Latescibacterota bacterium]MBT5829813.1 HDOD domain-containing protein [Candidatus Latescibacterota bacterium]
MQNSDILSIIEKADDLPTLPTVATKVMHVTSDSDTSVKEVAELIEKDLALSAKLLQVINSPFYGFSRGITSVSEAVGLMGFREVGNLALGLSVMGALPQDETIGFSFQTFWERCVGHAVSAVKITNAVNTDLSYGIFTTALLQDIGTCLLVRYTPLVYGYSLAIAKERNIHIAVAEREALETDHAEIGGRLTAQWNLPASLRIPIKHHHFSEFGTEIPTEVRNHNLETETSVLAISNLMTTALFDRENTDALEVLYSRATGLLDLDTKKVDEILDVLPSEVERVKTLFHPIDDKDKDIDADAEELPDSDASRNAIRQSTSKRTRNKILVAEDSAATRIAISNMLKRMGYDVVIAFNGQEAVALAEREKPDLILLDVLMPVMDGIDALRAIRGNNDLRTTPIVMLTSVTDVRMVTEAIESGANDYIAKPFQVSLLLERVERYIHAR